MSKENNLSDFLTDIADTLRDITETTEEIKAQDFTSVISSIGKPNLIEGAANSNGEYVAKEMDADGFSKFIVNVPIPEPPVLIEKTITENGTYESSNDNANGYSSVTVNVKGDNTDMLQARVDETKSCSYLCTLYHGTNPDIVKNLNTTGVTRMDFMFNGCSKLTTVNLSNLDTNSVTTMEYMFGNAGLTPGMVTASTPGFVELDVSKFNTSNVTNMQSMFDGCSKLTSLDVSNFDTSNVTIIKNIFDSCKLLTSLDLRGFNLNKVTNLSAMFAYCSSLTKLDVSNFNLSDNVTDMSYLFQHCEKLTEIIGLENFKTSKVKSMPSMFYRCTKLTNLNLSSFDTSKVTNMSNFCYCCAELESITGTINMESVTNLSQMFEICYKLQTVTLKNIKKTGLKIGSGTSWGHLLTLDTLINTVKELWDYSSGSTTYTLTMGSANLEKIANTYVKLITPTEEMIAADPNIVNKMPCVVCESTDEGAMLLSDYAIEKSWTLA